MDDLDKSLKRYSDNSKRIAMGLTLVMAAFTGWTGINERQSLADSRKNEAQYLASKRPAELTYCLNDQYEAFQSEFNHHSFDKQGALTVTLDPGSPATQACVDENLMADFNAEVRNKKIAPFYMEPMAALFVGVFVLGLLDDRRRKNLKPRPEIQWPALSAPPRHV
jgi:hypothetical protein